MSLADDSSSLVRGLGSADMGTSVLLCLLHSAAAAAALCAAAAAAAAVLLHCHPQGATNPVNSTASPPSRFNCTANRYGGLPVCFSW